MNMDYNIYLFVLCMLLLCVGVLFSKRSRTAIIHKKTVRKEETYDLVKTSKESVRVVNFKYYIDFIILDDKFDYTSWEIDESLYSILKKESIVYFEAIITYSSIIGSILYHKEKIKEIMWLPDKKVNIKELDND